MRSQGQAAEENLFLPGESEKGMYPILGYDKETDPKLMVGGFGLGVSAFRKMKEGTSLKFAASISKNTYWDEPIELRGYSNEPLGVFQYASSDLSLALNGTFHFFVARKMSLGAGLGARLFTLTLSRTFGSTRLADADAIALNRYYRPFLPVLPLEWSLKGKKMLYTVRYESSLSDRYKAELAEYRTDRAGVLYFEIGFAIN